MEKVDQAFTDEKRARRKKNKRWDQRVLYSVVKKRNYVQKHKDEGMSYKEGVKDRENNKGQKYEVQLSVYTFKQQN